jgi:DNA-binding NtrC family response regulator
MREISEDIPAIAAHHLGILAARMGRPKPELSQQAIAAMCKHKFPGNVRELRNILEHALIVDRSDLIEVETILPLLQSGSIRQRIELLPLKDAVCQFELDYIERTIEACDGNISRAATSLGLDRSYLYRKLKSLERN